MLYGSPFVLAKEKTGLSSKIRRRKKITARNESLVPKCISSGNNPISRSSYSFRVPIFKISRVLFFLASSRWISFSQNSNHFWGSIWFYIVLQCMDMRQNILISCFQIIFDHFHPTSGLFSDLILRVSHMIVDVWIQFISIHSIWWSYLYSNLHLYICTSISRWGMRAVGLPDWCLRKSIFTVSSFLYSLEKAQNLSFYMC